MGRRIQSTKLLGHTIENDWHRGPAPATSTGVLEHDDLGPLDEVLNWDMEFNCERSGIYLQYGSQFRDLIREVLADNGIEAD